MSERSFTSVGTSVASRSRRDVARTASGEPSNLRVALVADVRSDSKCAVAAPGTVFAASSDGPIRAYETATGAARDFIDRERDKPVSCMALVNNGSDLWVGGAAGDLTVFSARSPVDGGFAPRGAIKSKPFLAHDKGVHVVLNVRDRYVVTGGADFQTRVWSCDGKPACASHHHSGAVKCAIDFAPDPFDATLPPAVWTGASDGKVFAWDDVEGTGAMKESGGRFLSGASAAGVSAMCAHPDGHEAWVGYDDGRLRVFARQNGFVKNDARTMHSKAVTALVPMGDHVWSGGGDHLLCAWDAKTKSCAYILPDQGGFIRGGVVAGWGAWFLTPKKIRVWASDGGERYARKKRKEAENALEEARSDAAKLRGELEESEARSKMAAETSAGESARTRADLEKANDARAETEAALARAEEALKEATREREKRSRESAHAVEKLEAELAELRQDLETREKSSSELAAAKDALRDEATARHRAALERATEEKLRAVEAANERHGASLEAANAAARKEREMLRDELREAEAAKARALEEAAKAARAEAERRAEAFKTERENAERRERERRDQADEAERRAKAEAEALRSKLEASERRSAEEAKKAQDALAEERERLAAAETKAENLSAEVDKTRKDAKKEAKKKGKDAEDLTKKLHAANDAKTEAEADAAQAKARLAEAEKNARRAEAELTEARDASRKAKDDAAGASRAADESRRALEATLEATEAKLEALEAESKATIEALRRDADLNATVAKDAAESAERRCAAAEAAANVARDALAEKTRETEAFAERVAAAEFRAASAEEAQLDAEQSASAEMHALETRLEGALEAAEAARDEADRARDRARRAEDDKSLADDATEDARGEAGKDAALRVAAEAERAEAEERAAQAVRAREEAEARAEEAEEAAKAAEAKSAMALEDASRTMAAAEDLKRAASAARGEGEDAGKLEKKLREALEELEKSREAQVAMDEDLNGAERAMAEAEREIDDLKKQLALARSAVAPWGGAAPSSQKAALEPNHEEIFELKRRISNLQAEVNLAEIDKEKLRQLREAAESRRMEAEARFANAEVECARSRAAIQRIASLEKDLQRAVAAKEAGDEKHHAELRAVTSEAEHMNSKLEAELRFVLSQLERKREKKRQHKAQAVDLAHKLKAAVQIAKDTASDAEKAIAHAEAESQRKASRQLRETREESERNAANAAASASAAAQLAEALEKKRGKKKQYKSDLEHSRAVFERAREESRRAKASLVAANKLRESERSVAEAALARQAAEHETRAEALSTRVRELEAALKHAARDYKRVVSDVAPTKVALGRSEQTSEQIRLENLGLAQGLKRAEEAARTHERDAAEARRLLIEAERRFQLELEKNRRAWEQTSRGEYMGFDPYVDQGAVDGPKPGAAGRHAAKGDETIDDAPLYAGKGLDPSNVRPAGMSSEHLEAVARRERENAFHAKRQKDLGFGERAEYLDYDA